MKRCLLMMRCWSTSATVLCPPHRTGKVRPRSFRCGTPHLKGSKRDWRCSGFPPLLVLHGDGVHHQGVDALREQAVAFCPAREMPRGIVPVVEAQEGELRQNTVPAGRDAFPGRGEHIFKEGPTSLAWDRPTLHRNPSRSDVQGNLAPLPQALEAKWFQERGVV